MGQGQLGRKTGHEKDKSGDRFAPTTLSRSWTSLYTLFPAALLCHLNRKEYFPMETPSIALTRELFPFAKTNKKHNIDWKKRICSEHSPSPIHPLPEERWELLLTWHTSMLNLMAENQPVAKSLYQQDLGTKGWPAWNIPKKAGLEWSRSNIWQKIKPETWNKNWSVNLWVGEALTVFWTESLWKQLTNLSYYTND